MFFGVILTCLIIAAFCVTIGWMFAGMPNFFERHEVPADTTSADFHRSKWKRAGYVLHMPSYRNGTEKYVVPAHQNQKVPDNWLRGLYDTPVMSDY